VSVESYGGMILTGKNRSTRRKSAPVPTLSTTDPTWTDPSANPVLCRDRPVTNRLSYGTAEINIKCLIYNVLQRVVDFERCKFTI
jgi:hypothetical protein